MAISLGNRAKMTTSTTGTGTISLGSAVSGYQSFDAAGITNGQTVRYAIEDGTAFEIGSGTYTSSGTTLTRSVTESSNSDSAITLTGNAEVFITATVADLYINDGASTLTTTGVITGGTVEATSDTAAGDNAAMGFTSAEGLILTGQGSTNDVTIKNDADADVLEIPTGTTNVTVAGNLGVGGTVTATGTSVFATLDISGDVDVDGTLESDAITLNGTAVTATATLDTGISNNNVPKFTSGVADNDFLRVDGTAIEGRSASEVLSDIGAAPAAGSSNIVTTGALNSGSITSGFGTIDTGSSAITTTGVITGGTLEATTDTAAGDNAAIGYTAAEGLILTGQGSTSDITFKNDADATVFSIPTGTDDILFPDSAKILMGASSDLQIYHDGSNSIIADFGTGILDIKSDGAAIQFSSNTGELYAYFANNGAAQLFHDNVKKIETTSTGINVTGKATLTSGELTFSGSISDPNGAAYIWRPADNALAFGTANEERMRIDSAGNIIIASTGGTLQTATAGTSNFRAGVNAGNSIQSGGNYNVVVGDEAGTAITTGDSGTLVGFSAGAALTTGFGNTAIGFNALKTEDAHGSNVAIGYKALEDLNAGTEAFNIAIGYESGQNITTGVSNTIVGTNAGDALTDADYNVAIGSNALSSDTLGSRSVAIGNAALFYQNLTTATNTFNIAIGDRAGNNVTTGIQNTLIGGLAGAALTDADRNTAVGYQALTSDTQGSKSTALGYNALSVQNFTTATDSYNVAVGFEAGENVTTGVANTLMGGLTGDALTTGGYNVAVGQNALSADTLGSLTTAIGQGALANQNFTTATHTFNTAVGYDAGSAVTTGSQNTFVGGLAGQDVTTATENTFIGQRAGENYTTGDINTAVGSYALNAIGGTGTGTVNAAFGKNALLNNTSGSQNTALGTYTLSANTTASYNTAVGYGAGIAVTTGTQNTFVGGLSGDGTDDGLRNTAVGYLALSANADNDNTAIGVEALSVTTAANSTAVGQKAGSALTSGSNCLFLGQNAGLTGNPGGNFTTQSNALVIGNVSTSAAHVQVDWTVASDQRDKTDFTALDLGLDFVKALAPVTYKWDKRAKYGDITADDYDLAAQSPDGTHKEDWLDIGFKAQEVQALEEAAGYTTASKKNLTVSTSDDGKQMGLQYSKFVPILVKAIQEQNALIEALTARVATLEG